MSFLRVRGFLASGGRTVHGRGAASSGIGAEKTFQQPVYCQPEHWVRAWRWSPPNTQRVEDDRVSDGQCAGRNDDFASVADNRIKCGTPALVANDAITVFTSCLGVVPVAVIQGYFVVRHTLISWALPVHPQDQPDKTLVEARPTS